VSIEAAKAAVNVNRAIFANLARSAQSMALFAHAGTYVSITPARMWQAGIWTPVLPHRRDDAGAGLRGAFAERGPIGPAELRGAGEARAAGDGGDRAIGEGRILDLLAAVV
jgi:hypothetical protein